MEPRRIRRQQPPSQLPSPPQDSEPVTSVADHVWDEIEELGYDKPQRPYDPCPTIDGIMLDDLDDKLLMDLFRRYTAWQSYTSYNLAVAIIDERAATARLKKHEAFALIEAWGEGEGSGRSGTKRVTVEKARRYVDESVAELLQEELNTYARRKLMETLANNIQGELFAVSRELTRRGQINPQERRAVQRYGA